MLPNDPLLAQQGHLFALGNMSAIWEEYRGRGVAVGVFDDGVQRTHPDIAPNYDESLHYAGLTTDDGQPNGPGDAHGTAVAGIIAAATNGSGAVGVAPEARLTGVDFLNDLQIQGAAVYVDTFRWIENFDVVNASFGLWPDFGTYSDIGNPWSQQGRALQEIAGAAASGRDGLGTLFVKAAGNEANNASYASEYGITGNAQGDGLNAGREVVTVAAIAPSGALASYSNWGENLLVAAPAARVTTDLVGAQGYASGDHLFGFAGTSASAPVVSGVVALMLEANPDLGWRDVQEILAVSARHVGSALGGAPLANEAGSWAANGATGWNGGGLTYHASYGFGHVDAYAAVRMAEAWSLFGPPKHSGNEMQVTKSAPGLGMPLAPSMSFQLGVTEAMRVESALVEVTLSHPRMSDLEIRLVAPDGSEALLLDREGSGAFPGSYTFGVRRVRGLEAEGAWRVELSDDVSGQTGTVQEVALHLFGSPMGAARVHHVTEDMPALQAADPGRTALFGTESGDDWLNLSALSGQLAFDLSGGDLTFDGAPWASLAAGSFENAVTGDGDDTLTGSVARNELHGMRGNDMLEGGAGNDALFGGAGNDTLAGGTEYDALHGGPGDDLAIGGPGRDLAWLGPGNDTWRDDPQTGTHSHDTVFGGDGDDLFEPGGGADHLHGENGDDTIFGGVGPDRLFGGNGNDAVWGGIDGDVVWGGDGDDRIWLEAGEDTAYGGNGNDEIHGNQGADLVFGGPGNDLIFGGLHYDELHGGAGDDTVHGGNGRDLVFLGTGNDTFFDAPQGGIHGADTVFGGDGNDSLIGGGGDDVLVGGDGDDLLQAGAGTDLLTGGAGADEFRLVAGGGEARVEDFAPLEDRLRFEAALADGADAAGIAALAVSDGADLRFAFDSGESLVLLGLAGADPLSFDIGII